MSSGQPPSAASSTAMSTVFSERRSELVVSARELRAEGVLALTLADPSGAQLPGWTPGAHVDLLLDGDSLVRQYSLCGSPADQHSWRLGVLLDERGRGGSKRVHESVQVGDTVAVRGPRNHFPLHGARRYIFIAGGIGITPILPMVTTAEDERGLLPLVEVLGEPAEGALVYCCGPEGLLTAVEQQCAPWPAEALHVERFAAKPIVEAPGGDPSFEVVCQRSGVTVTVAPGQSIIDAVELAGVSVLSSCQEGVCGTCETRIVEGIPEHRDSLLSEAERADNEYMMICVSRAQSERLVLDL